MIDQHEIVLARPLIARFVEAVTAEDADTVSEVYASIAARFHVDGPQAVAVLCADLVREERERLSRMRTYLAAANEEATRNGEAYLTEKRRVTELRELLERKAAASTAGRRKEETS